MANLGLDREKAMAGFHGQAFRAVRVECSLGLRETAASWGVLASEVTALERGERRFQSLRDFKDALDQLWTWGAERSTELAR